MAFIEYLRLRGENSDDLFPDIVPILGLNILLIIFGHFLTLLFA